MRELEFWGLLLLRFFPSPRKCLNHYVYCAQVFLGSDVRTRRCDQFGNASVTRAGAAHRDSWFQLTPSSCQLNSYSIDGCWIAHIPCGISVAVGWQDFLTAWKVRLEFYWVEEPVRDRGRCSKYCLYVWLCIDFCCFYSGWNLLKEGYLKWVCASSAEYSHLSTQELLFLEYFCVLLLLRHPP